MSSSSKLVPPIGLALLGTVLVTPLVQPGAKSAIVPTAEKARMAGNAPKMEIPFHFEPGSGQAVDSAQYVARGNGYNVFVGPGEAVLALQQLPTKSEKQLLAEGHRAAELHGTGQSKAKTALIRFSLSGARREGSGRAVGQLSAKSNYFIGPDPAKWRTDVPHFASVRYDEVYPGIDLAYYGNNGTLEYDFVVKPGADPKTIKFDIAGADRVSLAPDGSLVLAVAGGEVRQPKPAIYQEWNGRRKPVAGKFALASNTVGGCASVSFDLADYDPSRPLVIDPEVYFATYFGGSNTDKAYSAAFGGDGSVYFAGMTLSSNLNTLGYTAGGYQPAISPNSPVMEEGFVAKLSSTGSLVYATYLGSYVKDNINVVAVDPGGCAYIGGYTDAGNSFPRTTGALQTVAGSEGAPTPDGFVTKLNAAGNSLAYSTLLGGTGQDAVEDIAVDSSGRAYVGGWTGSPGRFKTANGAIAYNGGGDIFLSVINPAGSSLVYSTYFGFTGNDVGMAVAIGYNGRAYVGGYSNPDPAVNPYSGRNASFATQPVRTGSPDAIVAGFDVLNSYATVTNSYFWMGIVGGIGDDRALGIAVDAAENLYISGYANSSTLVGTTKLGSAARAYSSGRDAFIVKANASTDSANLNRGGGRSYPSLGYLTFYGGDLTDAAYSLSVDSIGTAWITGETSSTDLYQTSNAFLDPLTGVQFGRKGSSDAFVFAMRTDGAAVELATYVGWNASDIAYGIDATTSGDVTLVGYTTSTDVTVSPPTNPVGVTPLQSANNGAEDAFVVKLKANFNPTAYAGPDQPNAQCPTVTLDGTGSTDSDLGDFIVKYQWKEGATVVASTGTYPPSFPPVPASPTTTATLTPGVHNLTLTVYDRRGYTATDTVVITVVDTTPPVISGVSSSIGPNGTDGSRVGDTPGKNYATIYTGTPTATDTCTTPTLTGVARPTGASTGFYVSLADGPDGDTLIDPAQFPVDPANDPNTTNEGRPDGITEYTITWTANDGTNTTVNTSQRVTVYDDEAPFFRNWTATTASGSAPAGQTASIYIDAPEPSDDQARDNVAFYDNEVVGYADNALLTIDQDGYYDFPIGTTTITWLAVDNYLNADFAETVVTVTESMASNRTMGPRYAAITAPAVQAHGTDAGQFDAQGEVLPWTGNSADRKRPFDRPVSYRITRPRFQVAAAGRGPEAGTGRLALKRSMPHQRFS